MEYDKNFLKNSKSCTPFFHFEWLNNDIAQHGVSLLPYYEANPDSLVLLLTLRRVRKGHFRKLSSKVSSLYQFQSVKAIIKAGRIRLLSNLLASNAEKKEHDVCLL